MPEKPKKSPNSVPCDAGSAPEMPPPEDPPKQDYYYDDSHGYQTYKGDEDDDQFEDKEEFS